MEINFTTFDKVPNVEGIVMRGCALDTQEHRDGFINGITEVLCNTGVLPKGTKPEDAWGEVLSTTTPVRSATEGGRCDLIMTFKPGAPFNMGRFAVVRLTELPDTSWISDWRNNDYDFYKSF